MSPRKSISYSNQVSVDQDFCNDCSPHTQPSHRRMSDQFPQLFKSVGKLSEIDTYAVHRLFDIHDPSGCIHHASRNLLLCGADSVSITRKVIEARDLLNRWLELNTH